MSSCFASQKAFEKQTDVPVQPDSPSQKNLSLSKWCANLVTLVFRSRTSFAAFARASIHLSRSDSISTSPAFPVPLPCVGVFDRMPSDLSATRRAKIHFRRALVLVILALDFWWSGNKFIDPELLKRKPSRSQRAIIDRVASLLRADGPSVPFSVDSVGRRVPKLTARLAELSDFLTACGPSSNPYDKSFVGQDSTVPMDNTVAEALEPYRSLDASRLKLVGCGHWDPTNFLSDDLVMAYRNPDALLFDRDEAAIVPKMIDPLPEVIALAKLWDRFGLLVIHEFDVPALYPDEQIKIFNCFKDASSDRQIGDRRGRNAWERKVSGPSKILPIGSDISEFDFSCRSHRLTVSVTDRKDFYHQFRSTFNRSVSNTLGPGIPREALAETNAYQKWLDFRKKPYHRLECGDLLGAHGRFLSLQNPCLKLCLPALVVFSKVIMGGSSMPATVIKVYCRPPIC